MADFAGRERRDRAVQVRVEPDVDLALRDRARQRVGRIGRIGRGRVQRADAGERRALVERAPDVVAADVDGVRRLRAVLGLRRDVRVDHDRRVGRVALAGRVLQLGDGERLRARRRVDAAPAAVRAAAGGLRARVVLAVVERVDRVVVAVAAARAAPVAQLRISRRRLRGHPALVGAVVLEADDLALPVERGDREVVALVPGLVVAPCPTCSGRRRRRSGHMPPSLPRKTRTGVAGSPSTRRAVEVHRLLVGVDADAAGAAVGDGRPREPAVGGAAQAHVGVEDVVLVLRVDPDLAEPPLEAAVGRVRAAADAQRVAAVVGVVEALVRAGRAAGDDVDAVRVARRDGDADAAEARVRLQAGLRLVVGRQRVDDVLQPLPRVAAVLGAEEAGADCRRRCACRSCAGGPTARRRRCSGSSGGSRGRCRR